MHAMVCMVAVQIGIVLSAGVVLVQEEQIELLAAIADLYEENRAAFTFGELEFRYERGTARSPENLIEGDWKSSSQAQGVFVFDGEKALYERLFETPDLESATVDQGDGHFQTSLESIRVLTNGDKTMTERMQKIPGVEQPIYGHVITPGAVDFFRAARLPLDLGAPESERYDLARDLRLVINRDPSARLLSVSQDAQWNGVRVVQIALKVPNGTRTYWVDLERGAIPLRSIEEYEDGARLEIIRDDLRQVPGRGWLPYIDGTFMKAGPSERLVIEEADFENRPNPERFNMKLSRVATVGDVQSGKAYRAQESINLDRLATIPASETVPLAMNAPTGGLPGPMPGERESRPPYFLMGSIALCVVVVLLWWKFRMSS